MQPVMQLSNGPYYLVFILLHTKIQILQANEITYCNKNKKKPKLLFEFYNV